MRFQISLYDALVSIAVPPDKVYLADARGVDALLTRGHRITLRGITLP
jgi:hypothetical protein